MGGINLSGTKINRPKTEIYKSTTVLRREFLADNIDAIKYIARNLLSK